ncbi:MAG TPA: hypothetical protein VFX59_08890 [Polyangiales bacterium]|nr:hypothetical protein [Polyangiales bacterium]
MLIFFRFERLPGVQPVSKANNFFIGDVTGTGTWELPQPTAVVIDRNQVARFVDVHPDWLLRTEADPIPAALHALVEPAQPSATA